MAKPISKLISHGVSLQTLKLNLADSKSRKRKAIFLDRDGTINVEPNIEQGYILHPKEIELNPMAGEAIRVLNDQGILTIVITNQAAIDKKLLSERQFEKINTKLWKELSKSGARYDALYYCPHSPSITPNCCCRKPKPGLIFQAAVDYGINLADSFMIGDKLTDIEAGHLSGCKTILLLSGFGVDSQKKLANYSGERPNFICENLKEAVTWLSSQES